MDSARKMAERALAEADRAVSAWGSNAILVSEKRLSTALGYLAAATRALLASEPAKAPFVSRNEEWGLRPDFTTAGVTAPPAAAEPAKGACADCGGCGGLGWIPAGDEQLGCIDCNGKGTIEPAPPDGAEVREAAEAQFGRALLPLWWDDGNPGDIDGSAAQDAAEASGLWRRVKRHADGVECEWCNNEEPCGELTDTGLAALRGGQKGGE